MGKNKKYRTDTLFIIPSFVIGMGSVLNIRGSYYLFNSSETSEQADAQALESDWGMVGQDIWNSYKPEI